MTPSWPFRSSPIQTQPLCCFLKEWNGKLNRLQESWTRNLRRVDGKNDTSTPDTYSVGHWKSPPFHSVDVFYWRFGDDMKKKSTQTWLSLKIEKTKTRMQSKAGLFQCLHLYKERNAQILTQTLHAKTDWSVSHQKERNRATLFMTTLSLSVNMHALWLKHLNYPLVPFHTVLHSACSVHCPAGLKNI